MSDNQALTTMKFDSKPLNGLRGILSIHIVLFHSILFSQAKSNIYGQVSCICYCYVQVQLINIGPDRLELIIFVIIKKKIDNHPSRLITAKSIMHYRFSSALYW